MRSRLPVLLLGVAFVGSAERLPLKIYSAADGLAHNSVNRIVRDSHGYLWFCTSEGLSRFDGYEFHNLGHRDGLPHRDVHDILETRGGEFWIATSGGMCRYQPKESGPRRFQVYRVEGDDRASFINILLEDAAGRLWCGTDGGLFRLEGERDERRMRSIDLGMPEGAWDDRVVSALATDAAGSLWVGSGSGLYRIRGEGRVERYTTREGLPGNFVTALFVDRRHRIWAGTDEGLSELVADPAPGRPAVDAVYLTRDGLGADSVRALHELADGTLAVATTAGLSLFESEAGNPRRFRSYSTSQGLPKSAIESLAEDAAGNLWIGTTGNGAAKLAWKTFVTYTADDGLAGTHVDSIFDQHGTLRVVTRTGSGELFVSELDGDRFRSARVNLPPEAQLLNWGTRSQCLAVDRAGNWWIGTSSGLLRYGRISGISDLAHRPAEHFGEREGLAAGPVFSVFADSDGGLWVSTTGRKNSLARLAPHAREFRSYSELDAMRWLPSSGVSLFGADSAGGLWMGLLRFGKSQPELARFRNGVFERIGGGKDTPSGGIRALFPDREKRLWVGTNQTGLMRIDDPGADHPSFTRYTTANGLSSDIVLALTEDDAGRIYVGNGSGVDRLDAATGRVKRYTTADGLAPGEVQAAFRDRNGSLWFGTSAGLSRLRPAPDRPAAPPPIMINSLRVAGIRRQVSELGETEISGLRFQPGQNDVEVDYLGLAFAPGETLNYQYMLEGADTEWSPATIRRSVTFANLSPGSYRFLVRAVTSEGIAGVRPASVSFIILPPLWLRWWFQLLMLAAVGAAMYRLHRYRVTRLVELERVRTRIATDLHDDIGSSLSQIAILSEVANREISAAQPGLAASLADIAGISRELAESMSDIVWAIDPERDQLSDLVHRMRRFASDVLSPRDIRLVFQAPAAVQDLPMGADLRRQVFLIFKEALHNVLRHSGAAEVRIELQVERGRLDLKIADDGRGFEDIREHDGHGLRSMRRRAESAGGAMEIVSGPGGTAVTLHIPVGRRTNLHTKAPHE
jgi:ligand-binding sensor domain-containing protein/signal transduction histidine kinase